MKRIDDKTALDLLANADLAELGRLAESVRKELHPDDITTFIVDRNITLSGQYAPREDAQKCRLSCAVGSDKTVYATARNVNIDVIQYRYALVFFSQIYRL